MISTMRRNNPKKPSVSGFSGNGRSFGNASKKQKYRQFLVSCGGILLIGLLVQAAGWLKGDALVFPGVAEILQAFFSLLGTGHTWNLIGTTLWHLLLAMAISVLAGLGIGLAEGLSGTVRNLLRPLMALLRSIPVLVLIVVLMVLMPYSRVPVVSSSLILIPLISEAACEGCRRIEPELIDVYRLNSGLSSRILFSVYLPLMAGYLRQAWMNAVGMGLRLAISAEYLVQTRNSLGKAIYSSSYFNEYQDIYAYALIMVLLILAVSWIPSVPGRLIRWRNRELPNE